jgi:uncharacterized protein YqjF (DUF2071 family)
MICGFVIHRIEPCQQFAPSQQGPLMSQIDRESPQHRPTGPAAGYQSWRDLTFIHWRVPVAAVRDLIPLELEIDTWEGDAWVAIVPFDMQRIRPWWSPAVPGVSWFRETNVRTYVHREGRDPGVWFFSLEASNTIAVLAARWGWKLPYFRARLDLTRDSNQIAYSGTRLWPEPTPATYSLTTTLLGPLDEPIEGSETANSSSAVLPSAVPGTLEHFLAERYYLYTTDQAKRLYRGQVHHRPYPLQRATVELRQESLLAAAGITRPPGPPDHVCFSPGVDVEVFPLVRLLN